MPPSKQFKTVFNDVKKQFLTKRIFIKYKIIVSVHEFLGDIHALCLYKKYLEEYSMYLKKN